MEQKDYKLEVVLALLQQRDHARAIANKLGTNHMLISRRIRELSDSNVVDHIQEGKNKTYYLKKTIEARSTIYMAENYRTMQTLEKYPSLRIITEKLQKDPRVKMALLFGSYAKNLADKKSDIDLYVETQDKTLRDELGRLDSRLSLKIGTYDRESPLIKEIERSHVVLKGVEEFYWANGILD